MSPECHPNLDYVAFLDKAIGALHFARASIVHAAVYDEREDFRECLEHLDQAKSQIDFLEREIGEDAKT